MSDPKIPTRTLMNELEAHRNIVMTNEPHEQPMGVLIHDDFETIRYLSQVLDKFELEVTKTMWVDEGRKFVLGSGQSVAIGADSRLD